MKKCTFLILLYVFQNLFSQEPGTLKWSFQTGGIIYSCPAVGVDGTIYFGSDDSKLYALKPDGTKKWEFLTEGEIKSSPAIGLDGTIYFGSYDKNLYALKPDGTKKWEFVSGGIIESSPAVSKEGVIYIGSFDNKLYAINSKGEKKWEFATGDKIKSSPSIGPDGTIYVSSNDKHFYAVNSNGTKKWEYGDDYFLNAAIGDNGIIYFGSLNKQIYALNKDGTEKWVRGLLNFNFPVYPTTKYSSPIINMDGTIYHYVYFYWGEDPDWVTLYSIFPEDGLIYWEFQTYYSSYTYQFTTSPIIAKDETIYVNSYNNNLIAFDKYGIKHWEKNYNANFSSSLTLDNNGTIYVGGDDGKLYAIYTKSEGLLNSPWPKFRKDLRNTGSSEIIKSNIKYQIILPNCNNSQNPLVIYEGEFMEGESCIFSSYKLPVQYSAFQPYYDAIVNSEFCIAQGALNENITLKINLEGICRDNFIDDPNTEGITELFFLNIEIIGEVSGSHNFLEYYYFNEGKEVSIKIPVSNIDPLLDILNYDIDLLEPFFLNNNLNPDFHGIRKEIDDAYYTIYGEHLSELRLGIVESPLLIKDFEKLPKFYSLTQNYPNPFNPSTTIKYSIPNHSNVTLKVFDLLGSEITTLVNKEQSQGNYEVEFDGSDLTSGLYFYRLQAADFVETKKMVLLK